MNIMVTYMYIAPGKGKTITWGQLFFKNKYSVHLPISCKFCPSNHILTMFPIQMHGRPMLTLPKNRWSRSSLGHDLYTFLELHCLMHCLMLHAKFQNHRRRFLKVFANYSQGCHLCHVTLTIYTNFQYPFLPMLHKKFGFDWPSGFRKDV